MSNIREVVGVKISQNVKTVSPILFVIGVYLFATTSSHSGKAKVDEETISPGGQPTFVHGIAEVRNTVRESLVEHGLPYFNHSHAEYTIIESTRGDNRESLVYAFVVDPIKDMRNPIAGLSVGVTLAKALKGAPWLAKDVFIVFVENSKFSVFFDSLYSGDLPGHEGSIIRGGLVLDTTVKNRLMEIDYNGGNAIHPNQDWVNVMFETFHEFAINFKIRNFYENILINSFNSNSPISSKFLEYGIPAFTLRGRGGGNVLEISRMVGAHLRVVNPIHHHLHHSTALYSYTGLGEAIGMGIIQPVGLLILAPLIANLFDYSLFAENLETNLTCFFSIFTFCFIYGFSIFTFYFNKFSNIRCDSPDPPLSHHTPQAYLVVLGLILVVITRIFIVRKSQIKFKIFNQNVSSFFSVVGSALLLFNWYIAIPVSILLTLSITGTFPLSMHRPFKSIFSLINFGIFGILYYIILTGDCSIFPSDLLRGLLVRMPGVNENEFITFLVNFNYSNYFSNFEELFFNFKCNQSFGFPILISVLLPSYWLCILMSLLPHGGTEPVQVGENPIKSVSSMSTKQKIKMMLLPVAIGYYVYQYYIDRN
jgi:hypothetical protein